MSDIKPYVDPALPPDAPEWCRKWCSDSSGSYAESDYNQARLGMSSMIEVLPIATDVWIAHPPGAILVNDGVYVAVSGIVVGRFGVNCDIAAAIMLCSDPLECDYPAIMHPAIIPKDVQDMRVLGYRFGVTPDVMRAIRDGRPYDEVRAMAAHPNTLN